MTGQDRAGPVASGAGKVGMKPRGRQRPAEGAVDTGGSMRFGLHALGVGIGARPQMIRAVSAAAEQAGFARLWSGEHVVMVDRPASRYPYSNDGQIAVPADADWLDPMLGLTFAAAATSRIGLATGILLLPEHNPVLVAKQAATLDVLSEGRLTLGSASILGTTGGTGPTPAISTTRSGTAESGRTATPRAPRRPADTPRPGSTSTSHDICART